MTTITAPYPQQVVSVVLPSAKFNDSTASESQLSVMHSMDGTKTYTYVKKSARHTKSLPLVLTREKAIELKEFIRIYYRAVWKVVLHDGSVWVGNLLNNPVDFRQDGKDSVEVTLQLSVEQG